MSVHLPRHQTRSRLLPLARRHPKSRINTARGRSVAFLAPQPMYIVFLRQWVEERGTHVRKSREIFCRCFSLA